MIFFYAAHPEMLPAMGVRAEDVDFVLLTHHCRPAVTGLDALVAAGARAFVPEAERHLFEAAQRYWAEDTYRVHCYHYHPSPKTIRESVAVARGLGDGDGLEWRGVAVTALATPGPTDGGMSFVVETDGMRVAFVGDLVHGHGRVVEFHSLQGSRDLPGGGRMMEYHGFGERAELALESLEKVLEQRPSHLIPSRGDVIDEPRRAVDALRENVHACMSEYGKTSAARWHFPGARPEWPPDHTTMNHRLRPLPAWVREIGPTSRAIVSADGAVFLIDCLGDVPDQIAAMQERGALGRVESLWITHYHDDHVGAVNALREREGCAVIVHESMADILTRPDAYLMPCLDPTPVKADRVTHDRESWQWREFRLTAFTFPGQSIYDAALLVERGEESLLFVGDSLSPSGVDDYCAHNRNLLGPGLGFDRCLTLVEELAFSGLLVNEHVLGAFTFPREELTAMRASLERRRELFRALLPWDDPNYGLDPQWVRCDPYLRSAARGETVEWEVHVRNYSDDERAVEVGLALPRGWAGAPRPVSAAAPPGGEGIVSLSVPVPADARAGRAVIGLDVTYDGRPLGEIAEAIVDVRE
jgi:glyoxylase-like metal-dependent hydrolase (beta-lactamase superfamily II)